jgi:hypothetical protein
MIPQSLPSPRNHQYPTRNRYLPTHLKDYHMFTTVAEDTYMDYPYCDAGDKTVDLAIKDENMMVHVCHYMMLHTAESIFASNPNNKKQYGLKAGLQKFASQGSTAIAKELTQLHTLKCFELTLNNYHTMQDTKLLPPLCSSQRNALVRSKLMRALMAAHNVHMWPRKKQLLQLSPWKLSLFNAQSLPTKDKMWPLVISLGLFYRLTTLILS